MTDRMRKMLREIYDEMIEEMRRDDAARKAKEKTRQ